MLSDWSKPCCIMGFLACSLLRMTPVVFAHEECTNLAVKEARIRVGLAQSVPVTHNYVPFIEQTFPQASAPEVLGPAQKIAVGDTAAAVYNPSNVHISEDLLASFKTAASQVDDGDPTRIGGALYTNFLEANSKKPEGWVSVLCEPVPRKNWPVIRRPRPDVTLPDGWRKPDNWGVHAVLYVFDGINHYAVTNSFEVLVRRPDGLEGAKMEVMVAPSLAILERMLAARYTIDNFSSQGIYQTEDGLLRMHVTNEADWWTIANPPPQ